ncbi:MAG: tetratricopeptide repeat protein [Crocinitomicaceae bacterium]|nr:tetratricopeptide repeat protein [Crocinitomicaceae bacterium]
MRLGLLTLVICYSISLYSQKTFSSAVDSLEATLKEDISTTERIMNLNELAIMLLRVDTVKAKSYAVQALELARKEEDKSGEVMALNWFARNYTERGQLDTALIILDKIIALEPEIDDKVSIGQAYISKGNIYDINGQYSDALEAYFKAEEIFEKGGYVQGVGMANMGIGNIYQLTERFKESIGYYRKSANVLKKTDSPYASWSVNNMATAMENLEMFDSAAFYYKQSLKMKEDYGDFYGASFTYSSLGDLYIKQGDIEKGEENLQKALEIKQMAEGMSKESIGRSYLRLGQAQMLRGKFREASVNFRKSLENAEESGAVETIMQAKRALSKSLFELGDYKSAYQYVDAYTDLKDSITKKMNTDKLTEMQTKYETAEKDAQLKIVKNQNELNKVKAEKAEADTRRANELLFGAVGMVALLLVAIIFALRSMHLRRKNNILLKQKNEEITRQKTIVEEKSKEIVDSITYAKRIQTAILPPDKEFKKQLPQSFVLYKPKDIVAGDFYWMESFIKDTNKVVLFAAADCTGHGVPGAMVSVICNNGLNRSVREYGITNPGKILDKTRQLVLQEFEKSEEEVMDGMDIALCALHSNTSTSSVLKYAGANNPLWIIRKGRTEVEEVKANKQPIGKFGSPQPYDTHETEVSNGDTIYIFSDGYADQFGGEKGKKMKTANFKQLLLSIKDEPFENHKKLLDKAFEEWKGGYEQLDDVCVIGVRI